MDKEKIITRIQDCGIVAVVRAETVDQAIRITDACIEGGVAAIELTFTVPHADKVIEELAKRYTPEEIKYGPVLLKRKDKEFLEFLDRKIKKNELIASKVTDEHKKNQILSEIDEMKQIRQR